MANTDVVAYPEEDTTAWTGSSIESLPPAAGDTYGSKTVVGTDNLDGTFTYAVTGGTITAHPGGRLTWTFTGSTDLELEMQFRDDSTGVITEWTARIRKSPLFTGTISDPSWTEGVAISTIDVSTNFAPNDNTTYSIVSGSLPPGVSLNTSNGQITGTPTSSGSYSNVQIRATRYGLVDNTNLFMPVVASVGGDVPKVGTVRGHRRRPMRGMF